MKMKKLAVLISIIGMAGGCAAPSPVVPSGYSRTPINTVEKIENYRIREATRLLRLRTMRHSDIARLTGFGDPYYFSKRFKQIMGCTPSEYELKTKENKDV